MKPSHALQRDWPMYYAGTWMNHREYGPVAVSVNGEGLEVTVGTDTIPADPNDLECWWPRSGSYNTKMGAVYIARKAARNMRKSASWGDHYTCTFGRTVRGSDPLSLMVRGPNYISVEAALELLTLEVTESVAVTRDIILRATDSNIEVIFRGNATGTLTKDGFEPYVPLDPLSKRAYVKLMQEGIR